MGGKTRITNIDMLHAKVWKDRVIKNLVFRPQGIAVPFFSKLFRTCTHP